MKKMSIISFVAISMMSLHAMELELTNVSKKSPSSNEYESLADNIFSDIEEQQQEQSKSVFSMSAPEYLEAVNSSLKLDESYNVFYALSDEVKQTVLRTMSTQLLYLHAIVFCLPPEVVKDHILRVLLDDEEEAVKNFYDLPFAQAFNVYHAIKSSLADDTIPVGPLYAQSSEVRELVIRLQKNPWYYSQPIISFEDNEEIKFLPDDIKSMYLEGKKIFVLPDDEHNEFTQKKLCRAAVLGGGSGLVSWGFTSSLMCCCHGVQAGCTPAMIGVGMAVTTLGPFVGCLWFSCIHGCKNLRDYSQQVTI